MAEICSHPLLVRGAALLNMGERPVLDALPPSLDALNGIATAGGIATRRPADGARRASRLDEDTGSLLWDAAEAHERLVAVTPLWKSCLCRSPERGQRPEC